MRPSNRVRWVFSFWNKDTMENEGNITGGADTGTSTTDSGGGSPEAQQVDYGAMFEFGAEDFKDPATPVDPAAPVVEAQPADPAAPPAEAPAVDPNAPAAEAAPATEQPAQPAVDDPIVQQQTLVAPLFQPFDTPQAGVDNAQKVILDLVAYDQGSARSLLNAAYEVNKPNYQTWALQDLGIDPALRPAFEEKASIINEWLAKGGDLPDPGVPQFPVPDSLGMVTLPDVMVFDATRPAEKLAYDSQKALFDQEQAGIKAQADAAAQAAKTQQDQAVQQADDRERDFGSARTKTFNDSIASLNLDYGVGNEKGAQMVKASAMAAIINDPQLRALDAEGARVAREGGSKSALIAQQMDDRINSLIKEWVEYGNSIFKNVARVEAGARLNDPKVPEGVKTIVAGGTKPTPPSEVRSPSQVADSFADEFRQSVS